ncbi:MAG: ABC transporter substrate binding protein [Pseudomonadota bacterium]
MTGDSAPADSSVSTTLSDIIVVKPTDPTPTSPSLPQKPPQVAVVLTSRTPAFEDVATALSDQFDDLSIYDLGDKSQPPINAFKLINDSPTDVVVAIGLRAARSSAALSAVPVVFSQVFNYHDHGLLKQDSRGVAAIAPMQAQLAAWKTAEPGLTTIGLVVGPGHDELLDEAELAAVQHNVTLLTAVVTSDQQALYDFKRMVRNIDGFWLLPDNRILSGRALNEIFEHSKRRGVSVLVPTPAMLSSGATISVSTVASDIAERIHDVVQSIVSGDSSELPPVTPLQAVQVEVAARPGDNASNASSAPRASSQ